MEVFTVKILQDLEEIFPECHLINLSLETVLSDIPDWDSLAAVNLKAFMLQKYGIRLPCNLLTGETSILEVIEYLEEQSVKSSVDQNYEYSKPYLEDGYDSKTSPITPTPNDVLHPNNIPIRVYTDSNDNSIIEGLKLAVSHLLKTLDLSVISSEKPIIGSWFKTWIAKANKDETRRALINRLKKAEKALELELIKKRQSTINKDEAEAASTLIKALDSTNEAVIQIGSILILKVARNSGENQLLVKNLTDNELRKIEECPQILREPNSLIKELANIDSSSGIRGTLY